MSINFTPLGTSSGVPTLERNVSSNLISFEDGKVWMFDAGEGTQHQLMRSKAKASRITRILITHLHGDHCFGLPGLLCSLSGMNPPSRTRIHIIGPLGIRQFLRTTLRLSDSNLAFFLRITELMPPHIKDPTEAKVSSGIDVDSSLLHPQEEMDIPLDDLIVMFNASEQCYSIPLIDDLDISGIRIHAAPIVHRVFCLGFVIKLPDQRGTLDATRLKSLGVPPGPLYGKIKRGESITLESGTTIHPQDVVGPDKKGKKIVYLGDTKDPYAIQHLAMDADVLYHETTLDDSREEEAIEKGHSCPRMAGVFAKSIRCQKMIISHFSSRFQHAVEQNNDHDVNENPDEEEELDMNISDLVRETQLAFESDAVIAAKDLESFSI